TAGSTSTSASSPCSSARCANAGPSERLVPADREPDRGADEADHAVGLDEVPPLLVRPGVDVLGEQAVAVAAAEHVLEQHPGLVALAQRGQRVDVPERARQE